MSLDQLAQQEPWDGKTERRKAPKDPNERSMYNVDNLIALAKAKTEEFGFSVTPQSLITRKDDCVSVLTKEIGKRIKNPPNQEVKANPEVAKYVDTIVTAQFQNAMDNLKGGKNPLYDPEHPRKGDVPPPTMDYIKQILSTSLTSEQLEVVQSMKNPKLQLIPPNRSTSDYVAHMDGNKAMDGQRDTSVSAWTKGAFGRADKRDKAVSNWKVAITEGENEPDVLPGEDINAPLRERNAWFAREYGEKGVSGVDLKKALLLMMDSIRKGEPINDILKQNGTATFVNSESEKDGFVSGVYWHGADRRVFLVGRDADDPRAYARLRASVVVDVPPQVTA